MEQQNWLEKWWQTFKDWVQQAAKGDGSMAAVLLIGIVLLALLLVLLRRLFRRTRTPISGPDLTEDLAQYPPPPAQTAGRTLTLYNMPVRLRLIVVAPLGYEASQIEADVPTLLDRILPGLGRFVYADMPRVRVWPTQLSHQGFHAAFRRWAVIPDEPHEPSRWVLAMGRILVERRPIGIGMALLANQENTLGRVVLEQPQQWMDGLRIRSE